MNAGRDSTWRRTVAAAADDDEDDGGGGGEVGESMEAQVVQLKLYDCARAKIEANLRWLFAKAYGHGKVLSSSLLTERCLLNQSYVCLREQVIFLSEIYVKSLVFQPVGILFFPTLGWRD